MSPFTRVETTTLLVDLAAGARDTRCPPERTEAMFAALDKAGNKPEGMMIPSGEIHSLNKEENNLKLYTEMLAFFERHIGATTWPRLRRLQVGFAGGLIADFTLPCPTSLFRSHVARNLPFVCRSGALSSRGSLGVPGRSCVQTQKFR